MQRRTVWIVMVAAMLSLSTVTSPALAGSPRTHDGFFLRLSGGGGSAQTEIGDAADPDSAGASIGAKVEMDGGTTDLNVAVGAVVAKNLVLHGTLFGWLASDPDVEFEGLGSGTATGDLDLTAYGGGLTYYFMPVNIYVSGSVGVGELSFDSSSTDSGIVGEITLGKEWWLGGGWGMGIAGAFGFHSIPDGGVDENWTGNSWAIRLSATMN